MYDEKNDIIAYDYLKKGNIIIILEDISVNSNSLGKI